MQFRHTYKIKIGNRITFESFVTRTKSTPDNHRALEMLRAKGAEVEFNQTRKIFKPRDEDENWGDPGKQSLDDGCSMVKNVMPI